MVHLEQHPDQSGWPGAPRRLWDYGRVQRFHAPRLQARNTSVYGPGTLPSGRSPRGFPSDDRRPLGRERCLLPCNNVLRGVSLYCELSYYLIQSPRFDQILTGVSPYSDEADVINEIRRGSRPPRPTDPSQNRWLQERVWDMITTCWSEEREKRCELPVIHHVFSTPSPQDLQLEFPPVGRENLIRLAEELLYMFLVLPLDPGQRAVLRTVQEYISDVISGDGPSPTTFSSADAIALAETFHTVCFPLNFCSVSEASGG